MNIFQGPFYLLNLLDLVESEIWAELILKN